MVPARYAVVLAGTVLVVSSGCSLFGGKGGGGGGGTSPSTVGTSGAPPSYMDEGARGFTGVHPAPVVVGNSVYVYINTGLAGTSVQASSDGLTFSPTAANYPAGIMRTIVRTPDGRFRMYYYVDANANDISSAVSGDGLNWTVEPGARYTDPNIGNIRATALPGGGVRIYAQISATALGSAVSPDGLTFTSEGPLAITPTDSAYNIGPSTVAYVNAQYHMVLTRIPTSTGVSELWHAISSDGRSFTLDKSVMVMNPGISINQPAWGINATANRFYYRTVAGGTNIVTSGVIRF